MNICVSDPDYGYYTTKEKIFNKGGDFTTAPELGQLFGEVTIFINPKSMAIWIEVLQKQMSGVLKTSNTPISIIELGPGSGKLATDILRSLLIMRKSLEGINMSFIDISDQLRTTQQQKVLNFLQSKGIYMNYKEIDIGNSKLDTFTSEKKLSICWGKKLREVMEYDAKRIETTGK